ncbi:MAG TPA: serine/threonine-protein kinase, partial [Verrucomicrobiae bacterium]|nr:serine/threonine-protein kinase [Verrucomicrobiae bacterium]
MSKATASVTDFQLSPGLRVCGARYLLKRLIGRAEFSELWLARDIKNTRDVALKFLPKPFLQDTNLLEFFREEVSREKLLKHPHIVQVYELAHDYDSLAIAMEFVDGWSLATLKIDKPDRRHSVSEIAPWLRELCDALTFAHDEFGILHGNLKPSNLLLSGRDGIKVSDFGFAAHIRNECSKRGIAKSGYAGIGYLSPQQVMGESPARADDIYSFGAVIFDLVTGTPPFYKGEILTQICSLKPPRMGRRLTELGIRSEAIPPAWEEAVAACLEKSPSDRPGTVEAVLRLLERPEPKSRANDFTEAVESALPTTAIRRESRRLTPLITTIAATFVVFVAVAAYWFARSGQIAPVVA